MSKQKAPMRFRRCIECGEKNLRSQWKDRKCPTCGLPTGWIESTHGRKKTIEINETREGIREMPELSFLGKERG